MASVFGSLKNLSPVRDVRILDAKRNKGEMDTSDDQTTTKREFALWQLTEVPPRLLPGLLTYAEIIKKSTNVDKFEPILTRPRPHPCLIHLDTVVISVTCVLSVSFGLLWRTTPYDLPQYSSKEAIPPMSGDIMPSFVARYRPQHAPPELKAPRDAELLYELGPELKAEFDSAAVGRSTGASGSSVTVVRADERQEGAMLFTCGYIVKAGTQGSASAAEGGEGRRLQPPVPLTDPREEEGLPSRGTSAPPLSCNLAGVMSSKKIDD